MAFVDTGGCSPALLLLHGFSDTSRSYASLEPFLAGYRLIIPDLPGHGGSVPSAGMHISDLASSMIALLTWLDVLPVAVIGHSMGAMAAIDMGSRGGIGAIVLISASLKPAFAEESQLFGQIRALRDPIDPAGGFFDQWYACHLPVDPVFLAKMRADAAAMPAKVWHDVLESLATTDLTQRAVQINVPVLCINGSSDPLFGFSHRASLLKALRFGRSVTLRGHGHNPHWESPRIVSGHLISFLAENCRTGMSDMPMSCPGEGDD